MAVDDDKLEENPWEKINYKLHRYSTYNCTFSQRFLPKFNNHTPHRSASTILIFKSAFIATVMTELLNRRRRGLFHQFPAQALADTLPRSE